ncbi:DUF2325 domain-containing protein [Nitrosomonas eutropha]|uniref:Uncharacterized protein DUF2325 n=2 Tax=Nitrosomonas eutropha TaxID=916 RepID=A0ABX5M7Q9_9PROT|nr:DUF2325 domain-containing protein [Nitrosomonas eutropha]ABI58990.1 conserved hypothetical protein [Nitrosomonas eutropha C91]PXV82218.1 uncharacterized protein DUF2325 [Nitrosomonas eutropha]
MHAPAILRQSGINSLLPEKTIDIHTPPVKRMKLWELDRTHHCPVIGLCLPPSDLECFARHFHFNAPTNNAHALHVEAVCCATSRNAVSETIHKRLDRLHRSYIKQFEAAKTDNEVLTLWRTHFSNGKVAGPLWAALTHKRISSETREEIHDTVHMHMHEAVAKLSAMQNRVSQTEQTLKELTEQLELTKGKHAQTELRLRQRLEQATVEIRQLQQSRREDDTLRQRLKMLESGYTMISMGQRLMLLTTENEQLQIKVAQADELKRSLKKACHNLTELYRERDTLHTERDTLENLLLAFSATHTMDKESADIVDAPTASYDCILCVGGRSAQLPHYRVLARQFGFKLSHHDGGQEDALSRLPEMVYGATAVICPTDCVSHAAYYQIKRLCRLGRKPCLLFKGTGISSFATALAKIAAGEASINNLSSLLPETTA